MVRTIAWYGCCTIDAHTHTPGTHGDNTMPVLHIDSRAGVQRGLVGDIIKRFEQKGYFLVGLKLLNVERALAEEHYADLSSKPFFGGLVEYIISAPVVAMAWRGKNVRCWLC